MVRVLLFLLLSLGTGAMAQTATVGGDYYAAGEGAAELPAIKRNVFAAGTVVRLSEPVAGDAHLVGLSVESDSEITGDLYAAGGSVEIAAAVGGDLTAIAATLRTEPTGRIAGNARLGGGTVIVDGPVTGSLVSAGRSISLRAPIGGDAWITANTVEFGSAARIGGTLHLATARPVEVPPEVAPPERVVIETISPVVLPPERSWPEEMAHDWHLPGALAISTAAAVTLGFLFVLGAVLVTTIPDRVEALRSRASSRPGLILLLGIAGISALVGLVPVSLATVIGIPFVPVAALELVVFWALGYLLGAYTVATAILDGLRRASAPHGPGARLAALALGLLIAALLNFVPVLGWIGNLTLGFLGIGAILHMMVAGFGADQPGPRLSDAGGERDDG